MDRITMDRIDTAGGTDFASSAERDAAFEHLQEIFKGKLDADVIYMVWRESEWKVNETFEKLLQLSADLEQQCRGGNHQTMPQTNVQIAGRSRMGSASSAKLSLDLHSRLPPSTEPTLLPMLSPKTPSVAINYPQFDRTPSTTERITSAMAALDSYAMHAESSGIAGLYPTQHSPQLQHSPQPMYKASEGEAFSLVETKQDAATSKMDEQVWPDYSNVIQDRDGPSPQQMDVAGQKKRVFRKKAYSLNPEEREALEDLIQNVIIDGVDDEAMDSDDSTSPGGSETQPMASGGEDTEEKDTTVYPPQLKVAVKHMKNLPPRFLKKIHISPRPSEIDLPPTPEGDGEEVESKLVPRLGIKKTIRTLMDGLDSYIDDGVELVEEVQADASPSEQQQQQQWSSRTGRAGVVSCADLEREMFAGTGTPHAHSATQPVTEEKVMRFSVDAPEFVPRAFTPSSSPNSQPRVAPSRVGRNSPAPAARMAAPVVPPTFMIPKVSAYPGLSTNISQHPGVVLGVPYQPYGSAATILPAPYVNAPLRQPYRGPPGFAPTDKTRLPTAAAGLQYPLVPLYVSPSVSGLSPAMVARPAATNSGVGHWPTPLVGYVVSPHSSPKAMRRVVQPHLISTQLPGSQRRLADLTGATLGAGVQYRCSPQSSPKARRRAPTDDGVIVATKQRALAALQAGTKLLVILRGCAGSGKSTLARELQGDGVVLTTDDFFKKDGVYNYNKSKLAEAHEWNRKRAKDALDAAVTPIIIDNTNSQSWEMKYYVMQALKAEYQVELLEPNTSWRYNAAELAERNIHSVSLENIQRMLDRFEHHVTIEGILRSAPAPGDEVEPARPDDAQEPTPRRSTRRRRRKRGKRDRAKRRPADGGDTSNDGERADGDVSSDEEDELSSLSPSPAVGLLHNEKPASESGSSVSDVVVATNDPSFVAGMSEVTETSPSSSSHSHHVENSRQLLTQCGDSRPTEAALVAPLHNGHFLLQFPRQPAEDGDVTLDGVRLDDVNLNGSGVVHSLKKLAAKCSENSTVTMETTCNGGMVLSCAGNHIDKMACSVPKNVTQMVNDEQAAVVVKSSPQMVLLDSMAPSADKRPALLHYGTDANCAAEMLALGKPLRQPCESDVTFTSSVIQSDRMCNGSARKSPPAFDSSAALSRAHAAVTRTVSYRDTARRATHSPQLDFWSAVDEDDCPWTTLTAAASAPSTPRPGHQVTPPSLLQHCATDSLLVDDLQRKLRLVDGLSDGASDGRRDAGTCTNAADCGGLGVLIGRSRDINETGVTTTTPVSSHHARSTPCFDKGCATVSPSHSAVLSADDGSAVLRRCFPTVARDDLEHILETCGHDVDWAANVLLDAGYEYHVAAEMMGEDSAAQAAVNGMDDTSSVDREQRTQPGEELVTHGSVTTAAEVVGCGADLSDNEDVVDTPCVPSLLCLCHAMLASTDALMSDRLHESLAAGSVRRMRAIAAFRANLRPPTAPSAALSITLTPELAAQLSSMFGPVPGASPDGGATVRLDVVTARHLHRCWSGSQPDGRADEQAMGSDTEQDEYLARILQEEEELACLLAAGTPSAPPAWGVDVADIAFQRGRPAKCDTGSLQEIMDEEMAIERSNEDQARQTQAQRDSLSTKLKRQKLHEMFPKVDVAVLEDVFQSTRYSFEATVRSLQQLYGASSATEGATEQSTTTTDNGGWQAIALSSEEAAMFDYKTVREEASLHARLRHQCFQKAERAHRHKMAAVAAFYAQQGHLHTEKMREANRVAAEKIMAYRASTRALPDNHIDLHGLRVDEAIAALRYSLASWELDTHRPVEKRKSHLYVMTGRGSHSMGGVARIRPAVINYLNRHKYRYSQPNDGVLKVRLQYRATK